MRVRRIGWNLALAAVALVGAVVVLDRVGGRPFYRDRRPTRAGKAVNAVWAWAHGSRLCLRGSSRSRRRVAGPACPGECPRHG